MAPMRSQAEQVSTLLAALDRCERLCQRDESPAVGVRTDVLRAIIELGEAPRVAVIARRGAGKSTLLNALAEAPVARVGDVADATLDARVHTLRTPSGPLLWLDTPGLRAGGREGRLDDVRAAVRAFEPTIALFLCAATEVDAGIDDDLDDLAAIATSLRSDARLYAVVTRVDELPPLDLHAPPFDDEKRSHIAQSVTTLHRHMLARGLAIRSVIPVCAFASWRDGVAHDDARWNLAPLTRALFNAAPRDVGADLEALLRGLASELVERVATDAETAATKAPGARGAEIVRARHEALVGCLDALLDAFTDRHGASLTESLGSVAKPGALFGLVRGALEGVGARWASGSLASARVRAVGRAVLALESLRPSESVIAALGAGDARST